MRRHIEEPEDSAEYVKGAQLMGILIIGEDRLLTYLQL